MKYVSFDDQTAVRNIREVIDCLGLEKAQAVHPVGRRIVRDWLDAAWQQILSQQYDITTGVGTYVIVSRHAGAIEWLNRRGYCGAVIEQATVEDVQGKVVIGNLPMHLAAAAKLVGSIDMPNLSREQRGQDLTPEQMDAAGACIHWYAVDAPFEQPAQEAA